jgi:hypothetical protein
MIAEDAARYLDGKGIGTYNPTGANGTIFIFTMPEEISGLQCTIGVFGYGGVQSDSKQPYDTHSVQVRVRGYDQNPQAPAVVAQAVYDYLHGFRSDELISGGLFVISCLANHPPAYIGQDANKRHEFTVNFTITTHNTSRLP